MRSRQRPLVGAELRPAAARPPRVWAHRAACAPARAERHLGNRAGPSENRTSARTAESRRAIVVGASFLPRGVARGRRCSRRARGRRSARSAARRTIRRSRAGRRVGAARGVGDPRRAEVAFDRERDRHPPGFALALRSPADGGALPSPGRACRPRRQRAARADPRRRCDDRPGGARARRCGCCLQEGGDLRRRRLFRSLCEARAARARRPGDAGFRAAVDDGSAARAGRARRRPDGPERPRRTERLRRRRPRAARQGSAPAAEGGVPHRRRALDELDDRALSASGLGRPRPPRARRAGRLREALGRDLAHPAPRRERSRRRLGRADGGPQTLGRDDDGAAVRRDPAASARAPN